MRRWLIGSARGLVPGFFLVFALTLGAGSAGAALPELEGTWYVLVHYKDSASNNPDFERWLDRIWVFSKSGSRLKWIEYPIVVFDDESGRFERTGGRYGRVMEWWEPSPGQRDQIRTGLAVNPRGSKTKTIQGSATEGWKSRSPSTAYSANTLSYTEIWGVEERDGLPVFTFEESLGGARAESLDGLTVYRTTEITPAGELRGTYNRDGTRTGTFRIIPAGSPGEVKKSTNQAEVRARAATAAAGESAAVGLAKLLGKPGVSEQDVQEMLMGKVLGAGQDPKVVEDQIRSLSNKIMAEFRKGTPPEEIERKVRTGVIAP